MSREGLKRTIRCVSLLVALLAAGACSAPSASPSGGQDAPTRARPVKTLTMAIQQEPPVLLLAIRADTSRGGGVPQAFHIAHDYLTVVNDRGEWVPQLAVELPSVERGTWRLDADGTMETRWQIRPGVKWHDGVHLTAEDLLFGFRVMKDPDLPTRIEEATRLMASATAPDEHTVVVRWSAPFASLNNDPLLALTPMPRHLLEEAYTNERGTFVDLPRFNTEFVGVGPYRLIRWEPGSHIELGRFDDYYRGKPPFDRVTLRFISDPSTMVASILAGELDLVMPLGVGVEEALEVQRRWEGTGNRALFAVADRFEYLRAQFRSESAVPRNAYGERNVREALYRGIDRATIAGVITHGLAPVADSWIAPSFAVRKELEAAIPQYPYDPARAQALLAEAGWTRTGDGRLVHGVSGERFEVELNSTTGSDVERKLSAVADNWRDLGIASTLYLIPPARSTDAEHRAKLSGVELISHGGQDYPRRFLHSRITATAANRWGGQNQKAYANPQVDALIDRFSVAIAPTERVDLERQLLQAVMGDVAIMPLFWRVDPYLFVKGIKGIQGSPVLEVTWNMFEWDKD